MKNAWIIAAGCVASLILSGAAFARGVEGRRGPDMPHKQPAGHVMGHKAFAQESLIVRIVEDRELAAEIGLTEDQIGSMKNSMYDLKKQEIKLNADLRLASLEQARLITESTLDEKAVMAAVERTGEIRTDIAKLKISRVLLLKKTLTPEQIEKVRDLMRERRKKFRELQKRERRRAERGLPEERKRGEGEEKEG